MHSKEEGTHNIDELLSLVDVNIPSSIKILWGIHLDRFYSRRELVGDLALKISGEEVGKIKRLVSDREFDLINQMINKHKVQNLITHIPGSEHKMFIAYLEAVAKSATERSNRWEKKDGKWVASRN